VVRLRSTFPMSRYLRAFDLAVAAAGDNAFHELLAFGVPTLFVPMSRNTDDPLARASWASGAGMALAVDGAADERLERRLAELVAPGTGERLRERCRELQAPNGAVPAAELVARMAAAPGGAPDVRDRNRLRRWLRLSSHPVGPSLPLSAALGARDLLRHPERRRPALLVLALGVAAGELPGLVAAELEARRVPADRTLVLTDDWDFASLRRLGVGFERLPAVDFSRETEAVEALRPRVQALLRGRRPLAAVSVGEHGAELIGVAP
jgi:hypothetical protein